jgi:hypothetical protein
MSNVNHDTLQFVLEMEFAKRYARLAQIIESKITDFVSWDNNGIRPRPLSDIDPERFLALKTYRIRQTRHGQRIQIVMHDKLKACNILMAVYQAHGKRLDRVGVVMGEEPVNAASTRPSACVTRAERPQAAQLEDMTEMMALLDAFDVEWPTAV